MVVKQLIPNETRFIIKLQHNHHTALLQLLSQPFNTAFRTNRLHRTHPYIMPSCSSRQHIQHPFNTSSPSSNLHYFNTAKRTCRLHSRSPFNTAFRTSQLHSRQPITTACRTSRLHNRQSFCADRHNSNRSFSTTRRNYLLNNCTLQHNNQTVNWKRSTAKWISSKSIMTNNSLQNSNIT